MNIFLFSNDQHTTTEIHDFHFLSIAFSERSSFINVHQRLHERLLKFALTSANVQCR